MDALALEQVACIHIYYCMTGRAIQGNIQFEGGSILARPQGGTIHNLRTEYSPVFPDPKGICNDRYDSNLMGNH